MSVSKSIRLKRLRVKPENQVQLRIDTRSGKAHTFSVIDCSINGIAVHAEWNQELADDVLEEDIISASKLLFDKNEVTLGRLVVKRVPPTDGKGRLAFLTIDTRVPVDGLLSRHLETNFDKSESPFDHELSPERFTIADFVGGDFTNIDILDRTRKFGVFYREWKETEKFGYFHQRDSSMGPRIKLARKRENGRSDYIMMGSNDYLGLAAHPAVAEAAIQAIREYGFGSTGTPHSSGYSVLHDRLCKKVATLFGKEDALMYASGYAANVGIVSGLCREQDLVIADQISHASIHDGISMSRATCRLFKHNDMNHLRKLLEENRDQYSGCLIITEGAFSMDGSVGKLDEIHKLAREFNARIMIDQAHCVGVLGKTGLGTVEKYNLIPQTDIIMGLFSKSLGSVGGFVTGSLDLCNWLRSFSRGFIFATSVPPSTAAATLKAIELMQTEGLREQLHANVRHFVTALRQLGAPLSADHETAIIPLEIRDEAKIGKMYQSLLNNGVLTVPVVYPVVSRNRCRFRFSVRADLSISDLDLAVAAIERAMKDAEFKFEDMKDNSSKAA